MPWYNAGVLILIEANCERYVKQSQTRRRNRTVPPCSVGRRTDHERYTRQRAKQYWPIRRASNKLMHCNVMLPKFVANGQAVAQIWQFNRVQDGSRPPFWVFKNSIFNGQSRADSKTNFALISPTVAEIRLSFAFLRCQPSAILNH